MVSPSPLPSSRKPTLHLQKITNDSEIALIEPPNQIKENIFKNVRLIKRNGMNSEDDSKNNLVSGEYNFHETSHKNLSAIQLNKNSELQSKDSLNVTLKQKNSFNNP